MNRQEALDTFAGEPAVISNKELMDLVATVGYLSAMQIEAPDDCDVPFFVDSNERLRKLAKRMADDVEARVEVLTNG